MNVSCVKEGFLVPAAETRLRQTNPDQERFFFEYRKNLSDEPVLSWAEDQPIFRNRLTETIPITQILQVYLLCYAD